MIKNYTIEGVMEEFDCTEEAATVALQLFEAAQLLAEMAMQQEEEKFKHNRPPNCS